MPYFVPTLVENSVPLRSSTALRFASMRMWLYLSIIARETCPAKAITVRVRRLRLGEPGNESVSKIVESARYTRRFPGTFPTDFPALHWFCWVDCIAAQPAVVSCQAIFFRWKNVVLRLRVHEQTPPVRKHCDCTRVQRNYTPCTGSCLRLSHHECLCKKVYFFPSEKSQFA